MNTHDERAEIADAGIRAMADIVRGQAVSLDLMIDASLRVLWAWCAPRSELLLQRRPSSSRRQQKRDLRH